jgi:pyridoxine 4-dehydrogenase
VNATAPAQTVRLGDREVRRIGLGSNRLTYSADHVAFIKAVAQAGLELIDTAHLYTGGESERTIGEALSAVNSATRPMVQTKGGFRPGEGAPKVLRQQIDQSLRELRTDAIDLYFLHRVDPETPLERSLATIKEYVDAGRIRHVGLSEVGVEQVQQARAIVPIAAVQNQYHLSERRWDQVVDYCEAESIVFVPFSPLHGTAPRLAETARARGATESQIALAWLLRRSPMMLPIPGSLSISHVRENLAAVDIDLNDEEFAGLS